VEQVREAIFDDRLADFRAAFFDAYVYTRANPDAADGGL
jgi:hypothetical protein